MPGARERVAPRANSASATQSLSSAIRRSAQGSSCGRPASIVSRWRTVTTGESGPASANARNAGATSPSGASMSSRPSSRSESTVMAMKLFVMEQMRKAVSASGAVPAATSRTPKPPERMSSPSSATP